MKNIQYQRTVAQIPLLQPLLPEELCGFFEPGNVLESRLRAFLGDPLGKNKRSKGQFVLSESRLKAGRVCKLSEIRARVPACGWG